MSKARKPATARRLPQKKALRVKADRVWAAAIKEDWAWKCAVCGTARNLEAHHLLGKSSHGAHRYTLMNGMSLCSDHHTFNAHCSPHAGDIGFGLMMHRNHADRLRWCEQHMSDKQPESLTQHYYMDRIVELESFVTAEMFREICGPVLLGHLDRIKLAETQG